MKKKTEGFLFMKNTAEFGALIEEWIDDPKTAPKKIDEFEEALEEQGIDYTWVTGRPKKLRIVQLSDDELMVVLPTKKMIDEGRANVREWGGLEGYPFAQGYDSNYVDKRRQTKAALSDEDWANLYLTRLGDYTVAKCM